MIGHYLLTLTPDQEHRVLTQVMRPGHHVELQLRDEIRGPCLVGTVLGCRPNQHPSLMERFRSCYLRPSSETVPTRRGWRFTLLGREVVLMHTVEEHYDVLCHRFGSARVNTAIRNRVLTNQARRALIAELEPHDYGC
jgi:hypothetical protein